MLQVEKTFSAKGCQVLQRQHHRYPHLARKWCQCVCARSAVRCLGFCRCNPAQRAHLLSAWGFGQEAPEEVRAAQAAAVQVESRLFQRFSECHGVWADAQEAEQ
jgi:hypothetical protein